MNCAVATYLSMFWFDGDLVTIESLLKLVPTPSINLCTYTNPLQVNIVENKKRQIEETLDNVRAHHQIIFNAYNF